MLLLRSAAAMSAWSGALRREGVVIGLVPTMGALHDGHRALIRAARLACDAVVVSVFVNSRQFGPGEDFARYPRRIRADAAACREEGADVLFAPTQPGMYPAGFQTSMVVRNLSRRWEGEMRPGHFEGVATVVAKLLNVVSSHVAFFGQKDFQQAVVVRRLVADLNLGVRVVVRPTVREPDGLAVSTRNEHLSPRDRQAATVLYAALQAGRAAVRAGQRAGKRVQRHMRQRVAIEPLARVDYLAVCDPETLEPLERITNSAVLLGAIRIGRIRLIDNVLVRV